MDSFVGDTHVRLYPAITVNKVRKGRVEIEFEGRTHELIAGDVFKMDVRAAVSNNPVEVTINPQVERPSSGCRCACCKC